MTLAAVATPVALALALLLAGCTSGGTAEHESAAPTSTVDDSGSGQEVEIPASFPSDEVPLIDGTPLFAVDLGTGWSVIFARDDFIDGFDEAALLLEGAGFTAVANSESSDGNFGQFTTEKYTVNLTATIAPTYGPSVAYLVALN
ncbi:MAG TPA: hypothetical protein VNS80_06310 [Pseudolysinimonas sp.]|nr:hypothetical protein [Pseudolysinimonas sp.]